MDEIRPKSTFCGRKSNHVKLVSARNSLYISSTQLNRPKTNNGGCVHDAEAGGNPSFPKKEEKKTQNNTLLLDIVVF